MTSSSASTIEGFELVNQCLAGNSIPVRKYRSRQTDLLVITADVPGPLVHGVFIVATEATSDDGLPHTLEHLIFLGSSDFPFKGSLDIIANRCLASGTNAWTDTDHTAYTVSTAGFDGFLALLPIYLDHLFFPTLTDSGFLTEVYHTTEEAQDSGVVFCEMQGRECDASCLTQIELMRALYPRNCGYRYETGGIVANLRYSTSIEKVRKFHEQFYCAKNTTLIITGVIDDKKLLDVIRQFETKIIRRCKKNFEKAWQTPVPSMTRRNIRAITYPSDQEDNGMVLVGWQGPCVADEYRLIVAIEILCQYLTETAASPLMKHFVETNDPFCSNISAAILKFSVSAIYVEFENVVIKKIELIVDQLMSVLNAVVDNTDDQFKFNECRMKSVIERSALKHLLAMEAVPQEEIAFSLIGDVLYGRTSDSMYYRLNHQILAKELLIEPATFWINLLKRYLIERPYAMVLAYPSKTEHKLRSSIENERIENRKNALQKDGLKQKGDALRKANEENQKLPPDDLIASIPAPSAQNLSFIPVHRYSSASDIQHPKFNIKTSPIFTQLDDLDSKFVYIYVIMNSSKISSSTRIYLPLLLEYLLACPVQRKDEIISFEKVAEELEQDIISLTSSVGLSEDTRFSCGKYSSAVTIQIKIVPENFEKSMNWIRELLYQSVFTSDRLKVVCQKLISSISEIRRRGNVVTRHLTKLMLYHRDTNHTLCTVLMQLKFLSEVIGKLADDDNSMQVIRDLELLRGELTSPGNVILHISANIQELVSKHENLNECVSKILPENEIPNRNRFHTPHDHEYISSILGDKIKSCVVGMNTADSFHLSHSTFSINDFDHPDLPAVLVFIQFLIQLEGPMWRDIRGFGLTYCYNIYLRPEEGVLSLLFLRAADVVQAFQKTINIFNQFSDSAGTWNSLHFESAKNSLIFEIVNREKDIASVSFKSVLSSFQGVSDDYSRSLVEKISNVQMGDMKKVASTYIAPLFDPEKSFTVIICHTSKCEDVAQSFAKMGFELQQFSSLEESYMNPVVLDSL